MRKYALLILFFFLSLIFSCDPFDGDCPKVQPYFSIQGLNIYNLRYTGQGSNPWQELPIGNSIVWDKFFMRIGFKNIYFSSKHSTSGSNLFARSCLDNGYEGSQVGIDTLYLIALQDYNSTHKKNDTLNDIILANYWTFSTQSYNNFFPLSHYIAENDSIIEQDVFELKIINEPTIDNSEQQFKLILLLNNGESFEAISEKVKLLKY